MLNLKFISLYFLICQPIIIAVDLGKWRNRSYELSFSMNLLIMISPYAYAVYHSNTYFHQPNMKQITNLLQKRINLVTNKNNNDIRSHMGNFWK